MSKPVVASITLFNAVSQWNDWFTGHSSYVIKSQTVSYCFTRYVNETSIGRFKTKVGCNVRQVDITGDSMQMAMIAYNHSSTIPFPFVQKHFVKGINIGSTKSKETKQ